MKMSYKPTDMTDSHHISMNTDSRFIFLFQRALLLGLKETGHLNEMQHRQAEATLLAQYREYIREHAGAIKDD